MVYYLGIIFLFLSFDFDLNVDIFRKGYYILVKVYFRSFFERKFWNISSSVLSIKILYKIFMESCL